MEYLELTVTRCGQCTVNGEFICSGLIPGPVYTNNTDHATTIGMLLAMRLSSLAPPTLPYNSEVAKNKKFAELQTLPKCIRLYGGLNISRLKFSPKPRNQRKFSPSKYLGYPVF